MQHLGFEIYHLLFAPTIEAERSFFSKYRPGEYTVEGENKGEMMDVISSAYISRSNVMTLCQIVHIRR